ncbi:hypothetical protein GS500_04690 [Rhodococcus hoagii]|nr:hypothetical protein [Prescottella equi]
MFGRKRKQEAAAAAEIPDPMVVHRVQEPGGSCIEPALDSRWPDAVKLSWHAAVAEADSGVQVRVAPANYSIDGVPQHGYYNIKIGTSWGVSSYGPLRYDSAWDYMNGVSAGARAVKRNGMGIPVHEGGERQ